MHKTSVPPRYFFCLGYAGPRVLGRADAGDGDWSRQLAVALATAANGVRARLGAERPVCIVGSLAQGADLAIAEAFLARGAFLRAWLPEPLDRFANEADFPAVEDRARVAQLAAHGQLAEVRVVSTSDDRRERFAECARAIVRDSDALLCVRHWDAAHGRGGTEETVALALALGRPIVEIRLDPDPAAEAVISFGDAWRVEAQAGALPFPRPDPRAIVGEWKAAASREAGRTKHVIVRGAAWTVGLQLSATLFAVVTYQRPGWDVPSLLVKLAVILAVAGITIGSARRGLAARWTGRRFAAELQRSWWAVRGLAGPATWLEDDLPFEFAAHGRDLALFHGLDRSASGAADCEAFRARYVRERIGGQRTYAERTAQSAERGKRVLQGLFHVCLGLTLLALFTKLALRTAGGVAEWKELDGVCSLVSILGPTVGAAAVSFVSLLDLKARRETQKRLAEFLALEERGLGACTDWAATREVVVATERRLLFEIKTWYARHAFRK